MWTERAIDTDTVEPTTGRDYPGPALDIEDCIIESNVEGFNKTFGYMMKNHGPGPWLNQALYMACSGTLFDIDPDAQKEIFDALVPHFNPMIDPAGSDIYLSAALAHAPWAVGPMMDAIKSHGGASQENLDHIALLTCQEAIKGHIQAIDQAAPDMFVNHDLSEMFWRKTFADKRAQKKLWRDRQWQDNPAFDRMLDMPRCATVDHHVARGLFNQATNAIGHEDAGALAAHLANRGWLTPEATAIAMAGVQHPEQEKNEPILAAVVRASLQRRTNMLSAAAPAQAPRL